MQSGTPVIASDCVTGPREVLKDGECGILFPVGDVMALKTAMWTLIQNKQLRQHYIEKGYLRAKDFHSEVILEQCARLFKQYIS
jgi:glycosyltransferase involved in cell wall biosynthesis